MMKNWQDFSSNFKASQKSSRKPKNTSYMIQQQRSRSGSQLRKQFDFIAGNFLPRTVGRSSSAPGPIPDPTVLSRNGVQIGSESIWKSSLIKATYLFAPGTPLRVEIYLFSGRVFRTAARVFGREGKGFSRMTTRARLWSNMTLVGGFGLF